MSSSSRPGQLTELLESARAGDGSAVDQLFEQAYGDLRALAAAVRKGRASETLNTTALVHEAYAKMAQGQGLNAENGLHFKRIVGRAMRQLLVDSARARHADKRGGDAIRVTLEAHTPAGEEQPIPFVDLERALVRLEDVDSRAAQVVECRFFSDMDVDETAEAMAISTATVKRDWRMARAWLEVQLNG